MKIFNLPDLGEGLPDAEIVEWHIKPGDTVKTDDPLVSMETAKAIVEIPAPYDGLIEACHGKSGDIIKTGSPLVEFEGRQDAGTVVGKIQTSTEVTEAKFIVAETPTIIATPKIRALARKLNIDINTIEPKNPHGIMTEADLTSVHPNFIPLKGSRRTMANIMTQAQKSVVPVSIYDDVDIHHWSDDTDITVTVIRAIIQACQAIPELNAHYDPINIARRNFETINLGLAMDTQDGLFVPVLKSVETLDSQAIRKQIEAYRAGVATRTIAPEDLQGATITLSNFGKWAGRYASPIVVPPTVAIIGLGKIYPAVVPTKSGPATHRQLPISLTFDHRALTGGECSKFLKQLIEYLQLY